MNILTTGLKFKIVFSGDGVVGLEKAMNDWLGKNQNCEMEGDVQYLSEKNGDNPKTTVTALFFYRKIPIASEAPKE